MARWHFSIFLVPENWAAENKGNLNQYLSSGWDLRPAWDGFDMPMDFFPEFMPPSQEWSVDLLCWHSTQADNNIFIGLNEENVEYFQIQIDMRTDTDSVIKALCDYASAQNLWILLMEEKRLLKTGIDELRAAAILSRAGQKYRFESGG